MVLPLVSENTEQLLLLFDEGSSIVESDSHPYIKLQSKYVARIVEGCNATSVIILFISFVIAFLENKNDTVFFIWR
jgi:exosortase family protein XrtF